MPAGPSLVLFPRLINNAAIAYYFDNKAEIDEEIETSHSYYEQKKQAKLSLLDQKLQAMDRD